MRLVRALRLLVAPQGQVGFCFHCKDLLHRGLSQAVLQLPLCKPTLAAASCSIMRNVLHPASLEVQR